MTQNEKDLLIKDLCARLQYGVKCKSKYFTDDTLSGIIIDEGETVFNFSVNNEGFIIQLYISGIKPYLFPLSSMSEEQKNEYNRWKHEVPVCHYEYGEVVEEVELYDSPESFEYLIENHFDYHGLIPMGLAIDATGLNVY